MHIPMTILKGIIKLHTVLELIQRTIFQNIHFGRRIALKKCFCTEKGKKSVFYQIYIDRCLSLRQFLTPSIQSLSN